jgi:hypothetical protein
MSLLASLTRAKARYVPPTIRIAFDTIVSKYIKQLSFDTIVTKYVRPPTISFDTMTSKYIPAKTALSLDVITSKYVKPLAFDVIIGKYIKPTSYTITISNNTGSDVQTIVIADPKLATWGKNVRFIDDVGSLQSVFVYNGVWVVKLRNPLANGSSTTIKAYNMSPYIDPSIALAYLDFETSPTFTTTAGFEGVLEPGFDVTRMKFRTTSGGNEYAYKSLSAVSALRVLGVMNITGIANHTKSIVIFYNNTSNYYAFIYKFYNGAYYLAFEKMVGGTWSSLTSQQIALDAYVLYCVRTGNNLLLKALKNGSLSYSLSYTDTSLTSFNMFGLHAWGSTSDYGYIDNLLVLPYEPDPTITIS